MRDDIAFRSQQYALDARRPVEEAQNRMNRSLEFAHGSLLAQQQQMQRQREFQHQQVMDADQLASDQVRRNQAIEELQWTRELHTTEMLASQRRAAVAASNLAVAQAQKAQQELGYGMPRGAEPWEMIYMEKEGVRWNPRLRDFEDVEPESQQKAQRQWDDMMNAPTMRRQELTANRLGVGRQALSESIKALEERRKQAMAMPQNTDEEKKAKQEAITTIDEEIKSQGEALRDLGLHLLQQGGISQNGTPAPSGAEDFYDKMLRALIQQDQK